MHVRSANLTFKELYALTDCPHSCPDLINDTRMGVEVVRLSSGFFSCSGLQRAESSLVEILYLV